MSIRASIRLEGEELDHGESRYIECPSCGREGKFSITRTEDGLILYHCFRASCTLHGGGAVGGSGRVSPGASSNRVRPRARFESPVRPLSIGEQEFLHERLGFTDAHILACRVRYCEEANRYAFPIFNYIGRRVGWVLRTWEEGATNKALMYMDDDETQSISYHPRPMRQKCAIIVEDIPSAVRAQPYMDAIALLGTSCNTDRALEIALYYDDVIWALDLDAFRQALRLQAEHRILFDGCDVLRLPVDIKDMKEEDIRALLT